MGFRRRTGSGRRRRRWNRPARWWPQFFGIHAESSSPITWKKTNDNWSVLCIVIAPVERINQEKASSFEKEKDLLPPRQCTGTYLRSFDGQNYGIKIRIITTYTVFTGFGPQWLFFISKLEKMAQRTTVHVERGGHRPRRSLIKGLSKILLFGRLKKVGETLGKVYRVKRRLCWKINKNLHKIICFSIFS